MANITRFDPFGESLEDLFHGFFVRPMNLEGRQSTAPVAQFRMDVTENDKEYRILAEIPGVKKEDINVTINGNEVAVSAEVKNEKDIKDGDTALRSERFYGKVYRAFTLGQDVDEAGAQAKYADGVLELILPKKAVASAKKLDIH
jgi:HSP20 family protein